MVFMKIGCGVVQKRIHGRPYLYVWYFQERGAEVRKVEKYMGPADRPEARRKALLEVDAYVARATAELNRRRARWQRQLGVPD